MAKDTLFVVEKFDNRQRSIDELEIGNSVALSRRVSLDFGITHAAMNKHRDQLRGILDQQAARARKKNINAEYIVENGSFMSRGNAVHICVICTRLL